MWADIVLPLAHSLALQAVMTVSDGYGLYRSGTLRLGLRSTYRRACACCYIYGSAMVD